MGFESDGTWVVNPYWSACGRFQVDPVEEYGMDFLLSPIAGYLGFSLPSIELLPKDLMLPEEKRAYESSLIGIVFHENRTGRGFVP